jgi:23S rRNA pseudouridine1911/1915/1917 synthase
VFIDAKRIVVKCCKGTEGLTSVEDREVIVADADDGQRLDKWLASVIDGISRSRIQSLIAAGHVTLTKRQATLNSDRKVRAGQVYHVHVPAPRPANPIPQDIPLNVLYEDEHLIVLVKPIGLVVHPAAGHPDGTLVNALLHHCAGELSGIGGVTRPGIVHRLDKDTSGVMVCAKSDSAHRGLVEQFQVHSISRAYYALVWGTPDPTEERLETQIGRHRTDRKRMAVLRHGGKHAITDYALVQAVGSRWSLLKCALHTGRTHQIRVHMAHIGHPLVGDPVYGGGNGTKKIQDPMIRKVLAPYNNQALQAYLLSFIHPVTGREMKFEEKLSFEMNELVDSLGHF